MNKSITILSFFILLFHFTDSFSQPDYKPLIRDTVISSNLEKGKGNVNIHCTFNDSTQSFTLTIGKPSDNSAAILYRTNLDAYDMTVQVIALDKESNFNEVAVECWGMDANNQIFFYDYKNGSIVLCGQLDWISEYKANGDKQLQTESWMGFWTKIEDYSFDAGNLAAKSKDTYPVKDVSGKVKEKITLLKNRSDDSPAAGSLKPGTKFTITKADISPKFIDPEGNNMSYEYYWYYIKASDGTEGWSRLKNFENNVEGLPWAG